MKKLIFFILAISIVLVACRNDNESDNQTNSTKINPPNWIKGKWKLPVDYEYYHTFTNNDLIFQSAGMTTNIKLIADLGAYSQTSSDTEFTFTTSMPSLSQTYKYKKVSSTKILTDLGLGGTPDIELIKQ